MNRNTDRDGDDSAQAVNDCDLLFKVVKHVGSRNNLGTNVGTHTPGGHVSW